jgi:uncharacterized protein
MRLRWASISLAAIALAAGVWALSRVAGFGAPALVKDPAGLLHEAQREHMALYHGLLLTDHDLDYRVELVRGVGDLDLYANRRFNELRVGSRSATSRGLLLVLDADQDQVRVEVGYGLEGSFPDAFVAYLERHQMVPYFRAGQIGDGVLAATELVVTRIQNARARAGWEAEPWASGSGGGGARARAELGRGPAPSPAAPEIAAQDSPQGTLRAYFVAMGARNGRPDLDLYTESTRALLGGRVVTPAQMDNLVRSYRGCQPEPARVDRTGTRAVIRYPVEPRRCSPFLLVRENGRWRLDFATAAHAIRFGRSNAWRLIHEKIGPYAWAFEDLRFDRHGFPHPAREG